MCPEKVKIQPRVIGQTHLLRVYLEKPTFHRHKWPNVGSTAPFTTDSTWAHRMSMDRWVQKQVITMEDDSAMKKNERMPSAGTRLHLQLIILSEVSSVQSLSHVRLCDPMDCSMPGLPVHHQLLEFTQTCPLSWWCHPVISFPFVPFCPQSFPASGSFQMSQFFASGG